MIPQKSAEQCTLHFSGLLNFPKARQAQAELARMFTQYAVHERHAHAVIRRWIEENKLCPTPVELREALLKLRVQSECPECNDMGWVAHPSGRGFMRCACTQNSEPDCLPMGSRTIPQATRVRDPDTHRVTHLEYAPSLTGVRHGEHPEVAIGIPRLIVTAKPAFKEKYAKQAKQLLGYDGPSTLAQAVEQGIVSRKRAEELIAEWENETGQIFTKQVTVSDWPPRRKKPPASELPPAEEQNS